MCLCALLKGKIFFLFLYIVFSVHSAFHWYQVVFSLDRVFNAANSLFLSPFRYKSCPCLNLQYNESHKIFQCNMHKRPWSNHDVTFWCYMTSFNCYCHSLPLSLHSGVNLLIGTDSGLMLLDRSGEGKVYPLISRKRFQQMDVLESQNILVCIAGQWQKLLRISLCVCVSFCNIKGIG